MLFCHLHLFFYSRSNNSCFALQLKIRLRTALQTRSFNTKRAGENNPTPNEIKHCLVIGANDDRPEDVDIDILTGRFTDYPDHETLLLFRLYNFKEKLLKKQIWPNNQKLQDFYKFVLEKLCRRDGFEAHRSGGSSGLPKLDADFFRFIQRPGSFPRKGCGVKFIKVRRSWMCVYIRVLWKAGRTPGTKFTYSTPRRGGQFNVSREVLDSFPFLFDFVEAKILAASILSELNKQVSRVPVQEAAVRYELSVIGLATQAAQATLAWSTAASTSSSTATSTLGKRKRSATQAAQAAVAESTASSRATSTLSNRKLRHDRKLFRESVIAGYAVRNKNTLVQHPVGFHRDIFTKNKQCLENRFCFVVHGQHEGDPMGRGGGGKSKFIAAILDWAK